MPGEDVGHSDVSHDQQLRDALRRYEQRFEPRQPSWDAIEARAARRRPRSRWWKVAPLAILIPAGAAVVIIVNLLPISIPGSGAVSTSRSPNS